MKSLGLYICYAEDQNEQLSSPRIGFVFDRDWRENTMQNVPLVGQKLLFGSH